MSNQNKVYTVDAEGWDDLLGGGLISDDILCIAGEKAFPRQEFLLRLLAKFVNNNHFPENSLIILYGPTRPFVELQRKLKRLLEHSQKPADNLSLVILGQKDFAKLLELLRKKRREHQRLVAIFLDDLEGIMAQQGRRSAQEILLNLHEQAEILVYTDTFDDRTGRTGPLFNTRQNRSLGEEALVVLEATTGEEKCGGKKAFLRNIDTDTQISFAIDEIENRDD